jgi:DNA-directed RNA polymerase
VSTINGVSPNLIHSLDAANIHILIQKILKNKNICDMNKEKYINLYTIHDCFASTADTMNIIERLVRESFAELYFADKTYINIMHENFLIQIKSYTNIFTDEITGKLYIIINDNK